MNSTTQGGVRCHNADACQMGQAACPTPKACGCEPAAPQAVQPAVPRLASLEAEAELGALRDVYEMARGVLRYDGIDTQRAIQYRDGLIEAIETVKTIDGGTWEPAHPAQQGLDADTLLRVIQRLNQNPYSLTKSECVSEVHAMRDAALAAQAKQGEQANG